jgi:CRISPR-associated protein Csm4
MENGALSAEFLIVLGMTKFSIYKLHFTTPVHLGDNKDDYGISLKTVQSDAFYAAITSCLAKLGETIPDDGDLGCTISSLFPFYQKDEKSDSVYFLPKPLRQALPNLENLNDAKKIKNVSWLDIDYFSKVINGEILFEKKEDIEDIKNKEYLTSFEIADDFIISKVSPRVTISRVGDEDAKPFYMDRIYFKDFSGLYFIIEGKTELFEKGMQLLQYEGIGTDRNVGHGYFEYSRDTIEVPIPKNSEMAISLSLFIPEDKIQLKKMLDGEDIAYNFIRRGGWITTPPYNQLRKNFIYAFLPGSVFVSLETEKIFVRGKIVNLKPSISESITQTLGIEPIQHSIWRNGKSIFIPIKV